MFSRGANYTADIHNQNSKTNEITNADQSDIHAPIWWVLITTALWISTQLIVRSTVYCFVIKHTHNWLRVCLCLLRPPSAPNCIVQARLGVKYKYWVFQLQIHFLKYIAILQTTKTLINCVFDIMKYRLFLYLNTNTVNIMLMMIVHCFPKVLWKCLFYFYLILPAPNFTCWIAPKIFRQEHSISTRCILIPIWKFANTNTNTWMVEI